jgi:plasmid stabilization system protein ParE
MARIALSDAALRDLERIVAYLREHDSAHADSRAPDILDAIDVLANNPHIGRSIDGGRRELVIGRKDRGYLALYRFDHVIDVVFVLAVRGQREAGYFPD